MVAMYHSGRIDLLLIAYRLQLSYTSILSDTCIYSYVCLCALWQSIFYFVYVHISITPCRYRISLSRPSAHDVVALPHHSSLPRHPLPLSHQTPTGIQEAQVHPCPDGGIGLGPAWCAGGNNCNSRVWLYAHQTANDLVFWL